MSTTRKEFLKTCATGAAAMSLPTFFSNLANASRGSDQPNILWLDIEDVSPDFSCYGTPLVKTPNLDQMAGEGVRFTNAFTSAPVCSPSRSAIATGMYQTTIGAHNHRSHRRDDYQLPEPVKVITKYFQDEGYFCTRGQFGNRKARGKLDFNFSFEFEEGFDGTDWDQREKGQPFFAQLHFHEVHRPFEKDEQNPIDPDQVELPPYYPDHPLLREDWALYLESIQVMDRKVGQVLERLEKEGLAENTAVFFTGDHGRAMLRGKQWLYDGGIRIPLLVRWPGHISPGTVDHQLINAIDLAPTWMKIAGIDPPEYLQGHDFLDPNNPEREYLFAARDRCDETDDRIRCVRTKRYKYIRNFYPERPYMQMNVYKKRRYPAFTLMKVLHDRGELTPIQEKFMAEYRPPEELYDLRDDPHEVHNLANDPDFSHTLKFFRTKLDEWIFETGDKGQVPEDPKIAQYWDKTMYSRYEDWMKQRGLSPDISKEDYLEWWKNRDQSMTE